MKRHQKAGQSQIAPGIGRFVAQANKSSSDESPAAKLFADLLVPTRANQADTTELHPSSPFGSVGGSDGQRLFDDDDDIQDGGNSNHAEDELSTSSDMEILDAVIDDNDCTDDNNATMHEDTEDEEDSLAELPEPRLDPLLSHLDIIDRDESSSAGLSFSEFVRFFPSPHNQRYFWQDYVQSGKSELFGGIRGIIHRAVYEPTAFVSTHLSNLADARLMFKITNLMLNSTHALQEDIADVFDDLLSRVTFKEDEDIRLPTCPAEIRATFLSGRHSIYANLPDQNVIEINNHAVISIDEKIDHIMAHGIPILFIQDENNVRDRKGIHGSAAAGDKLDELRALVPHPDRTAFGLAVMWSDGFLTSYVKQKNNSVWILTATFPDPEGCATSPFHTCCLAIGRSRDDHTPVIEYFLQEFARIRRGKQRYCSLRRKTVWTSFDMFVYLADLPERCSIMKTSLRGEYGRRVQYATHIDSGHHPYCVQCYREMISHHTTDTTGPKAWQNSCSRCLRWKFGVTSNARHLPAMPPTFPSTEADGCPDPPAHRQAGTKFMIPVYQSFDWLHQGILYACYNATTKNRNSNKPWYADEFNTYLRTMGVGGNARKLAWEQVKIARRMKTSCLPSALATTYLWRSGYSIEVFVASVMHQLFHGVIPDVMEVIHAFMKKHDLCSKFEDHVNTHLNDIASKRLGWCKIRSLPKKQWLAEDVLGFSRIMPFVYGQFFLNCKSTNITRSSSDSLAAIKQTVNALHVMISMLMSYRDINVDLIDDHIKIFLSCCDRLSQLEEGDKDDPFWLNKGNFISLLNIPDQIRRFGHIRLYWEGTRERFIQRVKKSLKSIRQTVTYLQKKLAHLNKSYVMDWIRQGLARRQQKSSGGNEGFHRYPSRSDIESRLRDGLSLSTFRLHGDVHSPHLHCAFGHERGGKVRYVAIQLTTSRSSPRECGFVYSKVELTEQVHESTWTELQTMISAYGLLVPYVEANRPFRCEYAAVFCDWDVIVPSGDKNIPVLDKELHDRDVIE